MKNETIQVGRKTYIKSKVVMLATKKEGKIWLDKKYNLLTHNDYGNHLPQHLYILSSEEIKEGDWQYDSHYKRVEKYFHGKATGMALSKIIATTDESLDLKYNSDGSENCTFKSLPRPSSEFLQAYCKSNGKIEEVLVELEESRFGGIGIDSRYEYKLKVASDNTITIKKVGKVYSDEEIEKRINMHDDLVDMLKVIKIASNYKNAKEDYGDGKNHWTNRMDFLIQQAEANKKSSC